jgi:tetratricopeptide (TPR) repeat protein
VALLATSAIALATGRHHHTHVAAPPAAAPTAPTTTDPLAREILGYQQRLRVDPGDWATWGNLGLAYVQEARITVNPTYYPKAAGVLRRSLALNNHGNFIALAGRGALEAARHEFRPALRDTRAAARINPYNPTIFGAMADAQTQLGHYAAARRSIAHMLQLHPGTPAFARLSYADELSGHVAAARADLRMALSDASLAADRAFAYYYLGELDLNHGAPHAALQFYRDGLTVDPLDTASLEGRAKAEAALGRISAAVRDFRTVVNRVPQPQYVLEFGELLQSLGRTAAAQAQYAVFATELKLFRANGVTTDLEPAQFYADHGNPALGLRYARAGIRTRPFLEVRDALAWALHRTGREADALRVERSVMRVGMRNATFYYHLGMIERSLGMRSSARHDLATALHIAPYFNPLQAPVARHVLQQLGGRS